MTAEKLTYCGDLVRRHDPDRFLISLRMAPQRRVGLWPLFAFNHEIAKTREIVTETTIGLIRLQWWRDALAEIYEQDKARENEILPELAEAIKTHDLPRKLFDDLVYAREFDLENVLPASLEGLENYADFTNTPLLKLALQVMGQEEDEAALRDIATAYGLTGLLRAIPFHARQQRCYMPADLMAAQDISARALYEFKPGENFKAVTKEVGERALALQQARPQSRIVKAHLRVSRLYLKQLRKEDYDPFSARLTLPPPFYHLHIAIWPL